MVEITLSPSVEENCIMSKNGWLWMYLRSNKKQSAKLFIITGGNQNMIKSPKHSIQFLWKKQSKSVSLYGILSLVSKHRHISALSLFISFAYFSYNSFHQFHRTAKRTFWPIRSIVDFILNLFDSISVFSDVSRSQQRTQHTHI